MTEIILTTDPEEIERIRAMTYDPAVGKWLMEVGLPLFFAEPFRTKDGEIMQVDAGLLLPMAGIISQYKRRPWTMAHTKKLRESYRETVATKQRREGAMKLLCAEADTCRKRGWRKEARRLDIAAVTLKRLIASDKRPIDWLQFSGGTSGVPMRPWVYMATQVAWCLVVLMRSNGQPRPSFGEKAPLVAFTDALLRFLDVDEPPPKTIGNTLRDNLDVLLKDWPKAAR